MSGHAEAPWNHDPDSPYGPPRWADIGWPLCGTGQSQSPIAIESAAAAMLDGPPLLAGWQHGPLTVVNTGHVIEVPAPGVGVLRCGDRVWQLVQYHFHAPGEHVIDGHRADVEAHFVHSGGGETAVVGVLFFAGAPQPSRLLGTILDAAPAGAGHEAPAGPGSPVMLLPGAAAPPGRLADAGAFYTYSGSLTTPDCGGPVRWFVLATPGRVDPAAVTRAHEVIGGFPGYGGYDGNARPVQPLNGRVPGFQPGGWPVSPSG
jgi:carbonic anhydrase